MTRRIETGSDFLEARRDLQQLLEVFSVAASQHEGTLIEKRCSRIELILRAAMMIMDNESEYLVETQAAYIISKLNNALGQYGLEVIRTPRRLPS